MPQLARRLLGAGLRSHAGMLAVGTSLANALGYVLMVAGARRLGPDEFGAFGALLALIVVGNVAALAVQATTARGTATGRSVAPAVRSGLIMAVVMGVGLGLLSPLAESALRLPSAAPAIAAAVAIAALTATAPSLGIVQGRERFRLLAALVTIQAALRVGGGLVGMALEPSATSALVGIAAGFVAAGVVAWVAARPPVSSPGGFAVRATLSSGAMLLGFVVLTNVDVMLARHVLPPEVSGLYAAGSIFTKIAFWLPQFVPTLAFPALADPRRRRDAMALGVVAVAVCGAVLTAFTWLFSDLAVDVVVGSEYGDVVPWVAGFAGLGALYALAHLLVYAHLARGDRWTTGVLWIVLAGYVLVVELRADDLAGVLVPGMVAAGVVVLWGVARERSWRQPTLP